MPQAQTFSSRQSEPTAQMTGEEKVWVAEGSLGLVRAVRATYFFARITAFFTGDAVECQKTHTLFSLGREGPQKSREEHRRRTEERDASLSIRRDFSCPLDEAVATMDETRENVASYMADVAADPNRAAFRDEVLRMLHRGEELRDFGLSPYRLGAIAPLSGVFVS